jgi:hypothetical protein
MNIYSGNDVTANDWNWNQDGSYGIIGMGPSSTLWEGFISPSTFTASYSIELARFTNPLGLETASSDVTKSNITLGSANDAYYTDSDATSMDITSLSNYTYEMDYFGFGKVYLTNGEVTSAYFKPFELGRPVQFAVNFKGMGLPTTNYYTYEKLLKEIASDAECSNENDGICTLQGKCSSYSQLSNYQFKMSFTTGNDYYLRVPLAAFAVASADDKCQLQITFLDY